MPTPRRPGLSDGAGRRPRRAQAVAEQTRQTLNAEIAKEKAKAEAAAHDAMSAADARIAATRDAGQGSMWRTRRATPPSPLCSA